MRRILRILAWIVGLAVALPVLLVALVLLAANTAPGQRVLVGLVNRAASGQAHIAGLSGRFPDRLRLARLQLTDARGVWLRGADIALDWHPLALIQLQSRRRAAVIDLLSAGRIDVLRAPVASGGAGGGATSLPVRVDLRQLRIATLEVASALAGQAARLAVTGSARVQSLEQGSAQLQATRQDAPGTYTLDGSVAADRIKASLHLEEPADGLVAHLATLPAIGAITADAQADGPRDALGVTLAISAGPLRAGADGTLDLVHDEAELHVTGSAPHMAPRPDLAWDSVALDARVHGAFTAPDATGTLRVAGLAAGGATAHDITLDLSGNAGQARAHAVIAGLRIPGKQPDLLAGAPLVVDATAGLAAADKPVTLRMAHPLMQVALDGHLAPGLSAKVHASLPDLAPLAAIGGVDLQGHVDVDGQAARQGDTTSLTATAALAITGGMAPVPALVGDAGKLSLAASLTGDDLRIDRATLEGRTLSAVVSGTDLSGVLALDWQFALSDLAALAPNLAGSLRANGHMGGAPDRFGVDATLDGSVSAGLQSGGPPAAGQTSGPLHATLHAEGLPGAPRADLAINGALAGSPVTVQAEVTRGDDGAISLDLQHAEWRSLHADAALRLPQGATLPQGHATVRMARMDDLAPLLGIKLTGALDATLNLPPDGPAKLDLAASRLGVPGDSVTDFTLSGTIADPATHPVVALVATANGIQASGASGRVRLDVTGPQEAIGVKLDADLRDPSGAPAHLVAAATVDAVAQAVRLTQLTADSRGLTARLQAPARFGFAQGAIDVDRLRLALGTATLDVAGKLSPVLDATVALRNVTPDLAKPVVPSLAADGVLNAEARLTGPTQRPDGHVQLSATGLRLRTMPGRALPPANITATADLSGGVARLDVHLAAGRSSLTVQGNAPLDAKGALALRLGGAVDLALLDPVLTANGRRVRGLVRLDGSVGGTLATPVLGGTATLAGGEIQDFTQGLRLEAVSARIAAEGDRLRIVQFTGQAGKGTVGGSGTIGVLEPGLPVDITVTARRAKLLDSDLLTATVSADLTVHGAVSVPDAPPDGPPSLGIAGSVRIDDAAIRVPESMPASVATLPVLRQGQAPPPPPAPPMRIGLDIGIDAPNPVFIRGRGLDAELEGKMHVGGTTAGPLPTGGLEMRRGTFTLAGTTLTFTTGRVQFGGGAISDPIIDFVAQTTTATVTATLEISGTASKPVIKLSSVPELPQDEVLAQLLFGESTSQLSPFQLASIAQALASLGGVNIGLNDPLERLRKTLGLDRLTVGGGGTSGNAAAVEAGSYVARGVYVGARQGIGRSGSPTPGSAAGTASDTTQATVQIDLTKRLKAQADVGTGPGGNAVGLTYQFEY